MLGIKKKNKKTDIEILEEIYSSPSDTVDLKLEKSKLDDLISIGYLVKDGDEYLLTPHGEKVMCAAVTNELRPRKLKI